MPHAPCSDNLRSSLHFKYWTHGIDTEKTVAKVNNLLYNLHTRNNQ
jgi:hypothetical protein